MRRRESGFSALEMIVVISVFGVLIWILVSLEGEMFRNERRFPVNYMTHPEVIAVLARLRKDVSDAWGYYPPQYPPSPAAAEFKQSEKALILQVINPATGGSQYVVWDFATPHEARRKAFNVGLLASDWLARGLPDINVKIDSYTMPDDTVAVRIQALDPTGAMAVDQIYEPRAH